MPIPAPTISDRLFMAAGLGRGLPEYAKDCGVEIGPVAAALGIDCREFNRFDARISLDRFCRLLETLATLANMETFGLMFGRRYELGGSGAFGYGLKSAPNLESAIAFIERYMDTIVDVNFRSFQRESRSVTFYWSYSPLVTRLDQFVDLMCVLMIRHFQLSAGATWLPTRAELKRQAPLNKAPHRKFISPNITFGTDHNALSIDASALKQPNAHADPMLFDMMSSRCAETLSTSPRQPCFQSRVEEEILASIGCCSPVAARIASNLGLSERTLQRRLSEKGVKFQSLVDKVRRELSDRLLREDALTIAEVAYRLGFSAPSAYTRSALRWYGASPSEMRRRLLA